jgi:hypothetical protein
MASVVFSKSSILRQAAKRPDGYVEDVLAHATIEGEKVTLTQEAYRALVEKYRRGGLQQPAIALKNYGDTQSGPGAELKKLLAKVGIKSTASCSCNKRARTMNEMETKEPGWCAANIDTIVGWLREEATKRKLPFIDAAGRLLVKRAIRNARKAEKPPLTT